MGLRTSWPLLPTQYRKIIPTELTPSYRRILLCDPVQEAVRVCSVHCLRSGSRAAALWIPNARRRKSLNTNHSTWADSANLLQSPHDGERLVLSLKPFETCSQSFFWAHPNNFCVLEINSYCFWAKLQAPSALQRQRWSLQARAPTSSTAP